MTDILLPILRSACTAILEIYADEDRFATELKADDSPLTAADKKANAIICEALADLYPGIPVISEEMKQVGYEERARYKEFFLVDPLDGTKEFIARNGEFTVNIAYIEGRRPVAGYIMAPVSGLAYTAVHGEGACRINDGDGRTTLRSRAFYLSEPGVRVVASRSHRDPDTEQIISRLDRPEILSVGSSLKFLLIAEGRADFYPRTGPTMEWDTAAAQCILEEAGGSVLQYDSLLPLVYNKPELLNPRFVATGRMLDPEVLPVVKGGFRV